MVEYPYLYLDEATAKNLDTFRKKIHYPPNTEENILEKRSYLLFFLRSGFSIKAEEKSR